MLLYKQACFMENMYLPPFLQKDFKPITYKEVEIAKQENERILRLKHIEECKIKRDPISNDKASSMTTYTEYELRFIRQFGSSDLDVHMDRIPPIKDCLEGIEIRLRANPKDENTLLQLVRLRELYQNIIYRQNNMIPQQFEYMFK